MDFPPHGLGPGPPLWIVRKRAVKVMGLSTKLSISLRRVDSCLAPGSETAITTSARTGGININYRSHLTSSLSVWKGISFGLCLIRKHVFLQGHCPVCSPMCARVHTHKIMYLSLICHLSLLSFSFLCLLTITVG